MPNTKEIRTKISSIQSTKKITRAMEMVAASKMRKSQDRRMRGFPYSERIRQVIGHLAHANTEYKHSFLIDREVQRVGFIVVSTDRGLCGGLNANLFKKVSQQMKSWTDKGVKVDLSLIGNKAVSYFRNFGGNVLTVMTHLGDEIHVENLIGGIKVMLDNYNEKKIDRLYIVYNEFINTMVQKPSSLQLLPLLPIDDDSLKKSWDYIYEPDAKELLDSLLVRYIESQVFQAVAENHTCEQAARMVAMKSATDNAGNLISDLQSIYNKARQAAITQELSEIVSGAAAV